MKSLKIAVFSTLLLVTGLAFGQDTANPKFPANANAGGRTIFAVFSLSYAPPRICG
jgi:hypothetical protein